MFRRNLLRGVFLLPAASIVKADLANGDPRLVKLYRMFLAPCCWRENLAVHRSPKADQLRAEIQDYVKRGWSDAQIRAIFVQTYTRRILAIPEGMLGGILLWSPWVATLLGATWLSWWIRRSVKQRPALTGPTLAAQPGLDADLDLPDLPAGANTTWPPRGSQ